jgi:hypothetical protein
MIEAYMRAQNRSTFPHGAVGKILRFVFPGSRLLGRGAYKSVYRVGSNVRDLALKTSNAKNIRVEGHVYKRLPPGVRNWYFGKIYWATKYCLLQKYGTRGRIPSGRLEKLKEIARRYGLTDVRPGNIRRIGKVFKIIDANPSRKMK